jgi:MFS family permease
VTDPVPAAAAAGASPIADEGHPRKWWILVAVSIGMFMGLLDVTIVNIAMPAITVDLHATLTHASWVLNAYSLVLAVSFLSLGRIGDRYGLKRIFMFGLVVFSLFSLLCGFAPTIDWLIAFPSCWALSPGASKAWPLDCGGRWAPQLPPSDPCSAACS